MTLLRDVEHAFHDWKGAHGFCRVRIYAATEASGGLPIVVLTEPNENTGPSVTNTLEQLAAEILVRYLGQQDGLEPPFVLVEHYPDRQPRGARARWHDPFFGEVFALVTFASWSLRPRWAGPRRDLLLSVGTPSWQHVSRDQVEALIRHSLDWPACSCAVLASSGQPRGGEDPA
jgi:hypothetical protein